VPTWRPRSNGVVWHEARLLPDEHTTHAGLPTTTVSRTILDLAATLQPHQLESIAREAERRGLGDATGLPTLLHRHPRRRGTKRLRTMLARADLGTGRTRSELEDRFLAFLDAYDLPRPLLNAPVEGRVRDCVWPAARVVVELDGREFHDDRHAFEDDRRRDRELVAAGWTPIRVTWLTLDEEEDDLAALLTRTTL
jgi:hypothetical protein